MNIVLTIVRINGPINAIFDLVTTARYWPAWHPSTVSVVGVTERPYQLGDTVRQMAHSGGRPRDGVWTVTEHCRPERVTLQMHGGDIEIRYTFAAVEGGTQVIRRLMYTADFVDGGHDLTTFEQLMHSESEVGLLQLKGLVEAILRQEAEHSSS
ncbi:MAG: SRPBCC family protein [Caldilineaceae bacterium]|nr:SRPBCC family protein [Caldilineaceae bacterium]